MADYVLHPLADAVVGLIFAKLSLVYGKRFLGSYDYEPAQLREHWAIELAGMSEASVRTRPGCRMAIVWAIIPPSDAPTTCAESTARASRRPMLSSAMSSKV